MCIFRISHSTVPQAGTELVHVPTAALLTTNCIPASFIERHDAKITTHGLLASFIANGSVDDSEMGRYQAWKATWPSSDAFLKTMPLLWPLADRLFPPMPCAVSGRQGHWDYSKKPARKVAAKSLVDAQQEKFRVDFEMVQTAFPAMTEQSYVHAWLIVNTRSFFYDLPLRRTPQKHDDKMILCPYIDYFNHADSGCRVQYDDGGYSVTADRDYTVGEQLFVSYGAHDNDVLWVDYGFVPEKNRFDCLSLDPWVLAPSTGIEKGHSHRLRKAGYLDNYHIVAVEGYGSVCHRTHVAVRAATMKPQRWLQFVRGKDAGDDSQADTNRFLRERILLPFRDTAAESARALKMPHEEIWDRIRQNVASSDPDACVAHMHETVSLRWNQMLQLIDEAMEHLDD